MLRQILAAFLLLSVFLCAGCAEKTPEETTTTTTTTILETGDTGVTGAMTEDQAFDAIEQEMEETAGDMSLDDLESNIL